MILSVDNIACYEERLDLKKRKNCVTKIFYKAVARMFMRRKEKNSMTIFYKFPLC